MKPRKPRTKRSPKWPAARLAAIKAHPYCARCGGKTKLQVHHKLPVSWPGGKEVELDHRNHIVLCEAPDRNCHLWAGHLGCWLSRNENVDTDCAEFLNKVKTRPYPKQETGHVG